MSDDPKPLTRKELAEFLPSMRAIKAFEKLFSLVPSSINDLEINVNDAGGKASQALSLLESISTSLELLANAPLSQQTQNEDNFDGDFNHSSSAIGEINNVLDVSSSPYLVIVDKLSDLPVPIAGVITLLANYTYMIVTTLDLAGNRLVCSANTTILGTSSENCRIKSTGLGATALISSAWSLPMRFITIEADVALALDASANADQALDWSGVNFTDCATIGTIKTYNNFVASDCAFLNSGNLTFDGTIGTIAFSSTLFDLSATSTGLILPSTLTVSRRFRIIYSSFIVSAGETGVNVSTSATIPDDGYILDTVNFSGGGTYTAGVTYSDNKALFSNNKNIQNSAEIAYMTMLANATATTISVTGTKYKAAGTTTLESISQKFTHASNKLTYSGAISRDFRILINATMTSGNSKELGLFIYKNGSMVTNAENYSTTSGTGKSENNSLQSVVNLATNDYLEVYISNITSATDITVTYLSVIVESINQGISL